MSSCILHEREGGVAIVTLNRPQAKNALDPEATGALTNLLRALRDDDSVRSVLLCGAGGDFCAGGDLKALGQGAARSIEQRRAGMTLYRDLALALSHLDKPVVAAIDGVAYGAGLSLALLCDIVLVSDRARMALVFHRVGLVPDVGAWYSLPRIVGLQRAKELVFSAREFGPQEAVQMNLALEVVPAPDLMARARAIAASFEGASALALSLSKQALQASLQSDLPAMLDLEASSQAMASCTDYTREAVRRFAAREPAQFRWPGLKKD